MNSFDYDPTATYPNVGERGCSSLQTVKMNLDKWPETMRGKISLRHQVVVALPTAQLEMLMVQDPEAFDSVEPVTDAPAYEVNTAVHEISKHLITLHNHGYSISVEGCIAKAVKS